MSEKKWIRLAVWIYVIAEAIAIIPFILSNLH